MNKQQTTALIATLTVAVGGAISIGLYQNSVQAQNCLSYENQLLEDLVKAEGVLTRVANMQAQVQANPFSAMFLMGSMTEAVNETNAFQKRTNDTIYAYKKTCGVARHYAWTQKPEVVSLFSRIQNRLSTIHPIGG